MLDYQTAQKLSEEIRVAIEENPQSREDTIWEEFVSSAIRYVGFLTGEYLRDKSKFDKYTEKDENGLTVQEFLNKSAGCALDAVENAVCAHLTLMSHILNLASIDEFLPSKENRLEFALYVAMFELVK